MSADRTTSWFVTARNHRKRGKVSFRRVSRARRLNIASAFYSRSMHNLLIRQLQDFVSGGGELRLLTSVMNYFNDPDDLRQLQQLIPGLDLRIFYPPSRGEERDFSVDPPPFHLKCYLFEKREGVNSPTSNFATGLPSRPRARPSGNRDREGGSRSATPETGVRLRRTA